MAYKSLAVNVSGGYLLLALFLFQYKFLNNVYFFLYVSLQHYKEHPQTISIKTQDSPEDDKKPSFLPTQAVRGCNSSLAPSTIQEIINCNSDSHNSDMSSHYKTFINTPLKCNIPTERDSSKCLRTTILMQKWQTYYFTYINQKHIFKCFPSAGTKINQAQVRIFKTSHVKPLMR